MTVISALIQEHENKILITCEIMQNEKNNNKLFKYKHRKEQKFQDFHTKFTYMDLQNQGLQCIVFLVGMSSVKWLLSSHSPGKFPNRLRVVNQSRRSSECTGHKWCTCGKEQTNNVYVKYIS